ncbi:nucleotidyltransferase family protein [Candidatus Peribacteria bacterium]|nr:nucleotidyltransferase family protein [Candidatus Peribacteria bacterium]
MRPSILRISKKHGATNVRVFGSFVRNEERKKSDLDLLVQLPSQSSLLDLVGLKIDLEEELKMHVDVLTDDGLSPYLRDRILQEATPL